jgi:hypothetical protein
MFDYNYMQNSEYNITCAFISKSLTYIELIAKPFFCYTFFTAILPVIGLRFIINCVQSLSLFGESAGDEENEFLRLQVGVRVLPAQYHSDYIFIYCMLVAESSL